MKTLKAISLTLLVIIVTSPLRAQSVSSSKARKARLEQEIALIDKQLKDNATKSRSALTELSLVRKKILDRNELISHCNREIEQISDSISTRQREMDALSRRLDTLSLYYGKLVRNAYKNRDSRIWYMYILASDDLGQAFRRIGYLRGLSRQMNLQAEKIREVQAEIEVRTTKLLALKADAQALKDARMGEVAKLKTEEAASQKVVTKLKRDSSKYKKELAAKKRQRDALNKEIARLISGATGSAKAGGKPKQPIDYTLDKEFANNKGKLPWPVQGPVVDKFGQHNHPVFTKVVLPFNNGISIAVATGTKAKAVFDGVVKQIVVMPGYNQCVLVQHGGYFSFYCKLEGTSVKAGDKVKTGDVIGTVGTIGDETQLHFQIWKGTTPQNPELWLR